MARVHHAKAEAGRFCDVIFPDPRTRLWSGPPVHLQHRLICCDCGLAHDFEFIVVEVARRGGKLRFVGVAPKRFAVQFRARRNERSTSQMRLRRKKRARLG